MLAILSAVVHGNGPNGLAVVVATLGALARLDQVHAAAYFQIVYNALREPVRRALEALIMERQTEATATFPPFAQQIFDRDAVWFTSGSQRQRSLLVRASRAKTTLQFVMPYKVPFHSSGVPS